MAVFNPWARHYQTVWENRAGDPRLPMWVRVASLAYGRHEANGHARFARGSLTMIFGVPAEGDKPFMRANRQNVNNAIGTAVAYGWLAEGSCMECLVVPGHAIAGPQGDADAPCRVHEGKKARHMVRASCHPDRKHYAKGQCEACYKVSRAKPKLSVVS